MPWRIVTRDLLAARPHLHLADLRPPGFHMRTYFDDQSVEILLGGGKNIYRSNIQAIVQKDNVIAVRATWFNAFHINVLDHIFVSLDVPREARDAGLAWMRKRRADRPDDDQGNPAGMDDTRRWFGNETLSTKLVENFGWPFELTDEALMAALDDPAKSKPRGNVLFAEARRRGLLRPPSAGDSDQRD